MVSKGGEHSQYRSPARGTLTIMAGGDDADFERARPLFEAMGELIVHVGELGQGQTLKLINNAVARRQRAALGAGAAGGRRAGVDLDALVEVMGAGSGGSAMLAAQGASRCARTTTRRCSSSSTCSRTSRLCLEEAQRAGAPFPFAAHARELLRRRRGRGLGDAGLRRAARRRRGPRRPRV